MSEAKLFEIFINSLDFEVSEYLVEELTELQKDIINNATFILKDNIVGDVKSFGGSVKKNEEKFKDFMKQAEAELEKDKYKEIKKKLKEYLKKLSELIIKTCVAIIPVKEMPWVDVVFRTIPRIIYDDKVELLDNSIAYYGEVKCFIGRTTLYGKIKSQEPLFAPFTGNLDLGDYKLDATQKEPKSHLFPYVSALINSLDSVITRNQLAKYHEEFQRHGDPICDFLMIDDELVNSMKKITTALESGRITSDIAVCSITVPLPSDKKSIVLITDESQEESRYGNCFEALLRLSASCCQVPSQSQQAPTQAAAVSGPIGEGIRTPGGQELKAWTAEELASEAQKRLATQPDLPTWSEEDLTKLAEERGSGLPDGMEVWKEDELLELAEKRRRGGLNIPEWQPDQDMSECSNCGYSLRPGWTKCPVCEAQVGEKHSKEEKEEPKDPSEEEQDEISEVEVDSEEDANQ
ncbi:MAG: hypothetical protein KGD70_02740 [Candidatus Lokiarchaeota archaeon]|nr:hypothetical protein [Candidatus Lokiarchaeota archaeon]